MTNVFFRLVPIASLCVLSLAACSRPQPAVESVATDRAAADSGNAPAAHLPEGAAPAFAWPASLHPFGDGYPQAGDACRRLGESQAVSEFLDHTRVLVGCPGPAEQPPAATLLSDGDGKVLATIDGVTVISLPPNAAL